jgi:hypothetical protein
MSNSGKTKINQGATKTNIANYKYESVEFLILYLMFNTKADNELLLLLLTNIPASVDELLNAIQTGDLNAAKVLLKNGNPRPALETASYYPHIIELTRKESDITSAEHILRYLLFFPVKTANPKALDYLMERYSTSSDNDKKHIISPYCWNAKTIFIGSESER